MPIRDHSCRGQLGRCLFGTIHVEDSLGGAYLGPVHVEDSLDGAYSGPFICFHIVKPLVLMCPIPCFRENQNIMMISRCYRKLEVLAHMCWIQNADTHASWCYQTWNYLHTLKLYPQSGSQSFVIYLSMEQKVFSLMTWNAFFCIFTWNRKWTIEIRTMTLLYCGCRITVSHVIQRIFVSCVTRGMIHGRTQAMRMYSCNAHVRV